jgi:hypothetical protein
MVTSLIRITIALPIVALALAAFVAALLAEWLSDVARRGPHPENLQ